MICDLCSNLPIHPSQWSKTVRHHSSFKALEESAFHGCQVCQLFKIVVVEYYAEGLCCSIEDVVHQLRQLDPTPHHQEDACPSPSATLPSPGEGLYFVSAVTIETYPASTESLRGFLYWRWQDGDQDRPSLNETHPFVEASALSDSIAFREWHVAGRPIATTADISLAKRWIDECITNHKDCRLKCHTDKSVLTPSHLPYRVLDLGISGNDLDVRLLVNAQDKQDHYATLSHCWGTSQPLRLLDSNYDALQDLIPFRSLPRTFQDAVAVTRSLGLRYIWIDSLCIIQDSNQDWEEQCVEMPQIYHGSYVTIAGPAATGCESGFLQPRPPPTSVTIPISAGQQVSEVVLSHTEIDTEPRIFMPERNAPLSRRAWVLQERLLSRRVLYFGTRRMYLECSTNVRFENCHHAVEWHGFDAHVTPKRSLNTFGSERERLEYWTWLVYSYSQLSLTKPTDRLPAMSGLASTFLSNTGNRYNYLAGIMSEDLPRSLAWYVYTYPWGQSTTVSALTTDYIAPSWSWASVRFGLNFPFKDCHYEFDGDVEIIEAKVTLKGLDPFGQVKDGYLDIWGRVQVLWVERLQDVNHPSRRTLYVLPSHADRALWAVYHSDNVHSPEDCEFLSFLFLGTYSSGNVVALAVKEVDGAAGVYRRVGMAFTTHRETESASLVKDHFKSSPKRKILLI